MPVVDDWSEEDDDQPSAGGSRSSGGGSGVRTTEASPQQTPEFTPWSRFVSANADVSQREANKLAAGVQGDVDKAVGARESAVATQNSAIGSNYNAAAQRPQVPQFGEVKPTASEPSFGAGRTSAFNKPPPTVNPKAAAAAQQTANRQDPGAVGGPKPAVAMFGGVNADKINTDLSSGKPVTSAGDISGAKDLEASMGAAPWSKLVGDTEAAEQKAGYLGSESGVKTLLGPQATGFDAALIGGAGGQGFRDTAKKYGGDSLSNALTGANETAQGAWSKLMGDIDAASAARDAEINAAQRPVTHKGGRAEGVLGAGGPNGSGWHPEGFSDLNSFLGGQQGSVGGVYEDTHTASQALSPLDWATRGLGEAGVDVPMASEAFSGAVAGGLAPKDHWQTSNVREGMRTVMHEYGTEAVEKLWASMTPEMWAAFMALGNNPGRVAAEMRAWLESAGFTKLPSSHQTGSQGNQAGVSTADATHGTTAEEEAARNQAARDGWLESYDEQFRNGNRNPVRP